MTGKLVINLLGFQGRMGTLYHLTEGSVGVGDWDQDGCREVERNFCFHPKIHPLVSDDSTIQHDNLIK